MTWEYRVVKRTMKAGEHAPGVPAEDSAWYAIHGYYMPIATKLSDRKGSITTDAVAPQGETQDELRKDLEHMLAALDKPELSWGDF